MTFALFCLPFHFPLRESLNMWLPPHDKIQKMEHFCGSGLTKVQLSTKTNIASHIFKSARDIIVLPDQKPFTRDMLEGRASDNKWILCSEIYFVRNYVASCQPGTRVHYSNISLWWTSESLTPSVSSSDSFRADVLIPPRRLPVNM